MYAHPLAVTRDPFSAKDSAFIQFNENFIFRRLFADLESTNSKFMEAISEGLEAYGKEVRTTLSADPDWQTLAKGVTPYFDKEGRITFSFTGTPEEVNRFNELEYGGLGTAPKANLRRMKYRSNDVNAKIIKSALGRFGR